MPNVRNAIARHTQRALTATLTALMGLSLLSCEGAADPWVATWSTSMVTVGPGFQDATLRQVARVSIGGELLRVRLSHQFGSAPTRIGAASVGLLESGANVVPGTLRPLTFDGNRSVELTPGGELRSDPVTLNVPTGASVVVSLYLEADSGDATVHSEAKQTTFVGAGNQVEATDFQTSGTNTSFYWLAGIEFDSPGAELVVVAFGDSITDGVGSTIDQHQRYPDVLARELSQRGVAAGVVNAGIAGNLILGDGIVFGLPLGQGPRGLDRIAQDALAQPGVTHVLLLEGVNDLAFANLAGRPIPGADIIDAYETFITMAHRRGVLVIMGTILPFRSDASPFQTWTAESEAQRQAINEWIRTTERHDGFVDFDEALRDPNDPRRMLAAMDSGDGLHPNDAGYQRMGEAAADVLAP